jgi:hypothetical protein
MDVPVSIEAIRERKEEEVQGWFEDCGWRP